MNDIRDMIQTCDLVPSEDTTRRLLDILMDLNKRVELLETRVLPRGSGYTCRLCCKARPANWFVYEIESDGQWIRPCCAECARENKSRGPFPPI